VAIKLLATADLHIGRRPTRLADEEAGRFSAAKMWERIVERAIQEQVAAVLLAGDVVDHQNRFFEAAGPLERGLRRLAGAAIPTFAVAGNHDWDVLPRIQQSVGGSALTLLGRDGVWEETVLRHNGSSLVRFQGWSFPQEHVRTSPLAAYAPPLDDGVPTIGMLHCDLDQAASAYVPVTRAELKRQPVSFWLLGHIHGFMIDEALPGPPLLYPGSPQAMDPGEVGTHGPWLIEVEGPRNIKAKQLALSPVRYELCEVDLSGATTQAELDQRLFDGVRASLRKAAAECADLARLVLRLRLVGETRAAESLADWKERLQDLDVPGAGDASAVIDRVIDDTRPEIDLQSRSRRKDLTGLLARLLLELESPGAETPHPPVQKAAVQKLLLRVHASVQQAYQSPAYASLGGEPPAEDEASRTRVGRQAWKLMRKLVEQEASA
jgi:DNA repair exonuclease SbcCD nuclease subunit